MSDLWNPVFGAAGVAAVTGDRAWIAAMCEVEAALARACATVAVIDSGTADEIAAACDEVASTTDPVELGRQAAADGNPVLAVVGLLRGRLSGEAAAAVHLGATSQDVLDSALMLMTRRALDLVGAELTRAADAAAGLTQSHLSTPMVARTLLQQALPTTFGATAAIWGSGLDRAAAQLSRLREDALAVQYGGAAGTMAAVHPHGFAIRAALADELDLAEPAGVWHTERTRIAEIAGALGLAAGAVGTVALDIVLLAQTEIGEVSERAAGGSSTMPHKRNPIAAVTARAAAARAPGLVATLLAAMPGEHQRAAGTWHAEWQTLTELLQATGGAAVRIADSLAGLVVNPEAMRRNLDATGGLLQAERVAAALAPRLGKAAAHALVASAAGVERQFAAALLADPALGLTERQLSRLLDPSSYSGHAEEAAERYLAGRRSTPSAALNREKP